ncbi:hypothetical protein THASP1DRAFT_29044 [Thamnocephalis sphaerospora]|uniref:Uncharacterized protein n=1 Tax=Thamnocephalis sphaerospora TaxID=78915 RepID=A0A4P9XSP4_9FUNG|nr:hypothetical protein THASP1DRAFT_29044 [Thamnocephalis sphaerospora]|eukprot:RKP09164.1 hypothetical protein THASP1DRAFT_29044 [Thamnocephalis sphaerospora]
MLPAHGARSRRSRSIGEQSVDTSFHSDGGYSEGGYSDAESLMSVSTRRLSIASNIDAPVDNSHYGQRSLSLVITNRHPVLELRSLRQCILSGVITCGRQPATSLSSGERRETVYASEQISRSNPQREETRGALIYQLRGRRGMPLSRRLFLFVAWSVPGKGPCSCVMHVIEADHATFPEDACELRGQFRRLTRQRMGGRGGARIKRRRGGTYPSAKRGGSTTGAHSDGEAISRSKSRVSTISSASHRDKKQKQFRERFRYVLTEDVLTFTTVCWLEIAPDKVDLRVEVYEELVEQYPNPSMMSKVVAPIWLEPIGDEGEDGDELVATENAHDMFDNGENGDLSSDEDDDDEEDDEGGAGLDGTRKKGAGLRRDNTLSERMFRHVTVTIRNRHRGLMLVGPQLDTRRGRCQNQPESSIQANGEDMTCVFRSGVLGATGIKGCLVYQLMPRDVNAAMTITQRVYLAVAWDVHASLAAESKSNGIVDNTHGRRLRAYLVTVDRPRFPHDRAERDRFFRLIYAELAGSGDGYRGARWCGELGVERFTCRIKPLLSGDSSRRTTTGIMAEFRPMQSSRVSGRLPLYLPPELFVFSSSTAALKVREVIQQRHTVMESERRSSSGVMVVLLENRHRFTTLQLCSYEKNVYTGERMQGMIPQIGSEEYEVATLLVDQIYKRQQEAMLGRMRTIFGHTLYEIVDTSLPTGESLYTSRNTSSPFPLSSPTSTMSATLDRSRKESRFLLIGWLKQVHRDIQVAIVIFRAVHSLEASIDGLPEAPTFRQYLYNTFISYAHTGTGMWKRGFDTGRPYNDQTAIDNPARSKTVMLGTAPLQRIMVDGYLGMGQTPVLTVTLGKMENTQGLVDSHDFPLDNPVMRWPPRHIYLRVENKHNGVRLINGRLFSSGTRVVTEVDRHILPNAISTGVFAPDTGTVQAIGVLGFQLVSTDGNLLESAPYMVISWCVDCQRGKESLRVHADILQQRSVGYDGSLGALHTPDVLSRVMPRGGVFNEWVTESIALLDNQIPYRAGLRVWIDNAGCVHADAILSGKGSRSMHKSSSRRRGEQLQKMSHSSSYGSVVSSDNWHTSVITSTTGATSVTAQSRSVSSPGESIIRPPSSASTTMTHAWSECSVDNTSFMTTDPTELPEIPEIPAHFQGKIKQLQELQQQQYALQKQLDALRIQHEQRRAAPRPSLSLSLQSQLSSLRFHSPRFFTVQDGALKPPFGVLSPQQTLTSNVEIPALAADKSFEGCIMYLMDNAAAGQQAKYPPVPVGTFLVIGWRITHDNQRSFFASIAHIQDVMAEVKAPPTAGSNAPRYVIDMLINNTKGRGALFSQLSNARVQTAGKSLRQAFALADRGAVSVSATMTLDSTAQLQIVLSLLPMKVPEKIPEKISRPPADRKSLAPSYIKQSESISACSSPTLPASPSRNLPLDQFGVDQAKKSAPMLSPPSSAMPIPIPASDRQRKISDASSTGLPSEMGLSRSPLTTMSPPFRLAQPTMSSSLTSPSTVTMLFCMEQRHRHVYLQLLRRHDIRGICDQSPRDALGHGIDSFATFHSSTSLSGADQSVEGWAVYAVSRTSSTTIATGMYCLAVSWCASPIRQHSQYTTALFRLDGDTIPMDDAEWAMLLRGLTSYTGWRNVGKHVRHLYLFADDSRRVALTANMVLEPRMALHVGLTEWTDADIKPFDSTSAPIHPVSAKEFFHPLTLPAVSKPAPPPPTPPVVQPMVVSMQVRLSLDNSHPMFALKDGLLLVVDGQQVQRPPPLIPSGQSIDGRFSITWTVPVGENVTMAPLACLLLYEVTLPNSRPLPDRPHLIVGWRVSDNDEASVQASGKFGRERHFFARIIGEHLAREVVTLWTVTEPISPDDEQSLAAIYEKDRFFAQLSDTALRAAGVQSVERRVLASGHVLLTHASLTSEEAAVPATSLDMSSVNLALKVRIEESL